MRTYTFKVVVEPDADRWHAYAPALVEQGGATWGYTREEALKNIHEVIPMVVESLIEHGEYVPEESGGWTETVASHSRGQTLKMKTLKTMIASQARNGADSKTVRATD